MTVSQPNEKRRPTRTALLHGTAWLVAVAGAAPALAQTTTTADTAQAAA